MFELGDLVLEGIATKENTRVMINICKSLKSKNQLKEAQAQIVEVLKSQPKNVHLLQMQLEICYQLG